MKNLKAIMASAIMLVAVLVMGNQNVEARQSNDGWTKFGDIDNPNEKLCSKKGNTCAPPVIIEMVIK